MGMFCLFVVGSYALTRTLRTLDVVVDFSAGSSELTAVQKQRLQDAVDRIRSVKWCEIEVAIVVGYAELSEVQPSQAQLLSEERAFSVASHLQWLGLSPHVLRLEGKGSRALNDHRRPGSNKHAVFEIVGTPPHANCPGETLKNGFWR